MNKEKRDLLQIVRYLRMGEPSVMYQHIKLHYQDYKPSVLADIIKVLLMSMDDLIFISLNDKIMNVTADEFSSRYDVYEE